MTELQLHKYVRLPLYTCPTTTHRIQVQYIELNYYSTSFLCKVMVNRSGFNLVFNSSDVHAYASPNNGSKYQLNNYFSTVLMPYYVSIALNNTIHQFNVSIITKFLLVWLCNKHAIVHEGPSYPSNQPHASVTFTIVMN